MDKKQVILIVDDKPENLQTLGDMLEQQGYEIMVATSGEDALKCARATVTPDLVLLDILMPEMDGYELCRILKADHDLRKIPVIFISALSLSEQKILAFLEGGVDYVTKPFQTEEVVARVQTHLKLTQIDDLKHEIAERKQIEEVLRLSKNRQAKMLANIGDVIVIIDQDGFNRYKSPNVEKWFGWKAEELVGNSAWDNVHPDDLAGAQKFVSVIADKPNATGTTECRYRCKDGGYKWIEITLVNLINDPDIRGMLGDYHDISERRRFEDEKRLLEEQFQQAQKLESLGVLAGGIAHDFNNILAIIIGNCSLAEMDPDRAGERIPIIAKAAERAAGLCRQMLAYAGKAPFSRSMVVMWLLVDEVVAMLKATVRQNVVIRTKYSPDVPPIMGDSSQLQQIIMNLIINASEAIGEEQGEVSVSLSKTEIKTGKSDRDHLGAVIPVGRYLCMEVSDNGCGMDDETRRRIFEPFYTTKFTGRGLGMSATLGIISTHKGALQLTSQPGQGSKFTIYLPIEGGETIGDESSEQIASTPWQGSGTVLLVEDEEQITLVARIMLEELGFNVIEASNGREALDLYQANAAEIKLVLTDIGMPIMDGYTLFRELKALEPELPIIISSGFGDKVVTTRIPDEKIADLISKPYRFDQLRDVVKGVVERTKLSGGANHV